MFNRFRYVSVPGQGVCKVPDQTNNIGKPSAIASASRQSIDKISVAGLFMRYMKLEGVDRVFGVPGAAIIYILDELRRSKDCSYVVCRHETGASFMADGYWRVSGKLGAVLVTSGPGALNALNGAVNADASLSQQLVITGEVSQAFYGRGWEQEGADASLDIASLYKNAVSFSAMVTDPQNFQTMMTTALRLSRSIPGRCSHLSVPLDVQNMVVENVNFPSSPANYRAQSHGHDPVAAASVLDGLLAAKRPLIFVGNGCRFALRGDRLQPFQAFVERFAIPVMTTLDGKGLFPETHDLSLRAYGKSGCLWPAVYLAPPPDAPFSQPYDYLLVIGSMLDQFATNLWNTNIYPQGPFVQVDARQQSIARGMPVDRGVIAEASAFIEDLITLAAQRQPDVPQMTQRRQYLSWLKSSYSPYADPKARESNAEPVRPERIMALISALLPPGSHVFADAGNSCGWTSHYLVIDPPTQSHAALEVGTMGYSIGAVIGAKLAAPEASCVAICGDGGFLMNGSELSTAAEQGAGAIVVVWSEDDFNMVSQGMGVYLKEPDAYKHYYRLGNPDIEKIAQGLGAQARTVTSADQFTAAFLDAIEGGKKGRPQVVVVKEDRAAMPPFYVDQFPWLEKTA